MKIHCAICIYTRDAVLNAFTIINGTAVCEAHLGYARAGDEVIRFALKEARS